MHAIFPMAHIGFAPSNGLAKFLLRPFLVQARGLDPILEFHR